jgi:hypothetical protein
MHRTFTLNGVGSLCLAVVFAAGLVVSPVMAQQIASEPHSLASTQEMAAKTVTINGKVKSVTESTLTVVDDAMAEHSISLDAKTRISKAGKVAAASELKAGDSVVVVASKGEGNALTAVTITVT